MTTEARFAGKTVIVTGAGSGIGRATAARLAHGGARLVATDIVPERLDELKASLPGFDVRTVTGDVAEPRTLDDVIGACEGELHGLANVAGIMDGFLPVGEIDDDTWDRVLRVNLTAPMRLTRAALPLLLAAGGGSIVNVASEAALRGRSRSARRRNHVVAERLRQRQRRHPPKRRRLVGRLIPRGSLSPSQLHP